MLRRGVLLAGLTAEDISTFFAERRQS